MLCPQTETEEFEFYLKFCRPLVINLSDSKDRVIATAWVKKLRDTFSSPEIKTGYLKVLLFLLVKRKLLGPFSKLPEQDDGLQLSSPLPEEFTLKNVAQNFVSLEREAQKEEGGSGDCPPYTATYSSDFKEYAVIQNIPNFGIQGYYAMSKEPMNNWDDFDKAIIPKGVTIPENISPLQEDGQEISCFVDPERIQKSSPKESDKSKVKFSVTDTSDTAREWSTATLKEEKNEEARRSSKKWVDAMKEQEFDSEEEQTPRKSQGQKDSPRSSRSSRSPRSSVCTPKKAPQEEAYSDEEDERIPPSWGSNLIHVKDSPKHKLIKKSATTLELYASFVEEAPNDEEWQTGVKSSSTLSEPSQKFEDAKGFEPTRGNIQDTSFGPCFMEDYSDVSLDESDVDGYKTTESPRETPKHVSCPCRKTRSPAYHLPTKTDTIESIPPRPKSPAKSAKRPPPKEDPKRKPPKDDTPKRDRDDPPRKDPPRRDSSPKKGTPPKKNTLPKREPPRKEPSSKKESKAPPKMSTPKREAPSQPVKKSPGRSPELSPIPEVCTPCSSKREETFGWLDQSRKTHKFREEEALEPEHWEDYPWWDQDPDVMFQFQPAETPKPGRPREERKQKCSLGKTPPVFSRDPEIRQKLVEDFEYDPCEFGLDDDEEWVEAEQYFGQLPEERTKPDDPRDYNRRTPGRPKTPQNSPASSPEISEDRLSMSYMDTYDMFGKEPGSPFCQRLNATDRDIFFIHPPVDFDISYSDQAVAGSTPEYSESIFEYEKSPDFGGIQNRSWDLKEQDVLEDELIDESMDLETGQSSCDESCQGGKGEISKRMEKEETPKKGSPRDKPAEKKVTPKSPEVKKKPGKKSPDVIVPSAQKTTPKKKAPKSPTFPTVESVQDASFSQDNLLEIPEKKAGKAAMDYETTPELKKKTPKKKPPQTSQQTKTCAANKVPDAAGTKYALDDSPTDTSISQENLTKTPEKKVDKAAWSYETPPELKKKTPKKKSPPTSQVTKTCAANKDLDAAGTKYALDDSPTDASISQENLHKTPEKKVGKAAWNYETPPEFKKKTPKKKSPQALQGKKTCAADALDSAGTKYALDDSPTDASSQENFFETPKKKVGKASFSYETSPDLKRKTPKKETTRAASQETKTFVDAAGSKYAQTLDDSPIEFAPSPKTPSPKKPSKRSQQTSPPKEDKTCSPCTSKECYGGAGSKYAQTYLDQSPMQLAPTPRRASKRGHEDKSVQDYYKTAQTQFSDNLFDEEIDFAPSPSSPMKMKSPEGRRYQDEGRRKRSWSPDYFGTVGYSDNLFDDQPDFAPSPTTPSPRGYSNRRTSFRTERSEISRSPGQYYTNVVCIDDSPYAEPIFPTTPKTPGLEEAIRRTSRPSALEDVHGRRSPEYHYTEPNFSSRSPGFAPRRKTPVFEEQARWSPQTEDNIFEAQPHFAPSPTTPECPTKKQAPKPVFEQERRETFWSPGNYFEMEGNADLFNAEPNFAPSPRSTPRRPRRSTGEYKFVGEYSPEKYLETMGDADNLFETQPDFAPSPNSPETGMPPGQRRESCTYRRTSEALPQEIPPAVSAESGNKLSLQPGTTNIHQPRDPYAVAFRQELELKEKQPYSPQKSVELQCGRRRVKVRKGLVRPELVTIKESDMEHTPINYMDVPQGEPSPTSPMVFRGSVLTPKRGMPPVYPNQPSPYEEIIDDEDMARLEFRRYEYPGHKPVDEETSSPKGAIRKERKGRRLFVESPKAPKRSPQKASPDVQMVSPDFSAFDHKAIKEQDDLFDQDLPLGFEEDIYGSPIQMPDFDDIFDLDQSNLDNMNDISLVQSPQFSASPGTPEADVWNMYGAVKRHERIPIQRRSLTRKPMIPRLEEVSEYPEEQYPFWDHRRLPRTADEKLTGASRKQMDRALRGDMDWLRRQQEREEAERRKIFEEENQWLMSQERKVAAAQQEKEIHIQEDQARRRSKLSPQLLARIQKARQIQPVVIDSPTGYPTPEIAQQSPTPATVQWDYQTPPQYKSSPPKTTPVRSPTQKERSLSQREPSPQQMYESDNLFAADLQYTDDIFSAPPPDLVISPDYVCSPELQDSKYFSPELPYDDPGPIDEQWDQYMKGDYDALDSETEPELVYSPQMDPLDRAWMQEVDLKKRQKMEEKEYWDLQVGRKRYKAMRKPAQEPELQPIREEEKKTPRDSLLLRRRKLAPSMQPNQPQSPAYQRPDVDLPSPVRTEFQPAKPKQDILESPKGMIKPKPRRLFEEKAVTCTCSSEESKETSQTDSDTPQPMLSPKISKADGVPKVFLRTSTTSPESPKDSEPTWQYQTPPELKTKSVQKPERKDKPISPTGKSRTPEKGSSGRRTSEKGASGRRPSEKEAVEKIPKKKVPEKSQEKKTPDKSDKRLTESPSSPCQASPQYERNFQQIAREDTDQLFDETPYFIEEPPLSPETSRSPRKDYEDERVKRLSRTSERGASFSEKTPERRPKQKVTEQGKERKSPDKLVTESPCSCQASPQYEQNFERIAREDVDHLFDEIPYFIEDPRFSPETSRSPRQDYEDERVKRLSRTSKRGASFSGKTPEQRPKKKVPEKGKDWKTPDKTDKRLRYSPGSPCQASPQYERNLERIAKEDADQLLDEAPCFIEEPRSPEKSRSPRQDYEDERVKRLSRTSERGTSFSGKSPEKRPKKNIPEKGKEWKTPDKSDKNFIETPCSPCQISPQYEENFERIAREDADHLFDETPYFIEDPRFSPDTSRSPRQDYEDERVKRLSRTSERGASFSGETPEQRSKNKAHEKGKERKTPDKSDKQVIESSFTPCQTSPQYEQHFKRIAREDTDQLFDEAPYFIEEPRSPEKSRSPRQHYDDERTKRLSARTGKRMDQPPGSPRQSPRYERDFNQMATRNGDQLFDETPDFPEEPLSPVTSPRHDYWNGEQINFYCSNIMEEQMPDWSEVESPRRLSDEEIWDMNRRVKEQHRQPIQRRQDGSILVGKKRLSISKAGKPKRPELDDLQEEGENVIEDMVSESCEQSCGGPPRPQMLVLSPEQPIQTQKYNLYTRPEYQWDYQTPPKFKPSQRSSPVSSPTRPTAPQEMLTPSPEQSFERPDYFNQSPYNDNLCQYSPPPELYTSYESPNRSSPVKSHESPYMFDHLDNQFEGDLFEEQPAFAASPCSTSKGSPCYGLSPRVVRTPKPLHPSLLIGQTPPSARRTPRDDPQYVFPEMVRFEQPRSMQQMNQANLYSPYDQRMAPTRRFSKNRRNLIEDFILAEREDEEAMVERFNSLARAQGDRQSFLRSCSPPRMTVSPGQVEEYQEINYEPREFDFYRCPGDVEYNIRPAFEGQPGPGLFPPGYTDELTEEERNFKWMDKLQKRR